ncbi:mycothiol conjugate amidase Mca [Leucobacter sp. UCMA 4100]|uniref:mycothiol conjugate amidase Mca n=1 Tax=Leucobacter sp. UCMA 4100 TaxID=2810534 RepID=UPI0022EAE5B0|nr:mycothiol conjugate amidase Mca [Leucobacter sp. UCMA 4100]MDA3147690.1 mycothiol conjugate amidase Mca [Leucobacter sp. UCMA 4100]
MALRLMAVHAHPDDESSKGAATYAHYLNQGAEVMVVSCTGGERGDILNELAARHPKSGFDLAGQRREEMANATRIIGFEHRWLGYEDSGYVPEGDPVPPNSFGNIPIEVSAEPLVALIREFKPHVIVTYNERGGYPHADHIRCHEISYRAWQVAGDPTVYPEAGEAWQPLKLYYEEIFNLNRAERVLEVVREREPESALVEMLNGYVERVKDRPVSHTTSVNVGGFFENRDEALRAHASQVEPDHPFFFWPNDLLREAWPFEDYRLAESRVETQMPEDDLFAGIEESSHL